MNEPSSPADHEPDPVHLGRLALTYALMSAAIFAVSQLRGLPFAEDLVPLAVAGLFLVTAIARVGYREDALRAHGMALGGLLAPAPPSDAPAILDLVRLVRENARSIVRESAVAFGLALVIFPPFVLAFGWWNELSGWPRWAPNDDFLLFSLAQVVVVAVPEEAFFRGYFQTRLARRMPLPLALFLQAAAFAFVHLATGGPARLAVFFPGLLFGLIRHWRGGIGAALVFHALCNMLAELLYRGWVLT